MRIKFIQTKYLLDGVLDAPLSPLDRGFAYGDGVFRTMLVQNGVVMFWATHYQKLCEDCRRLSITAPAATTFEEDFRQLDLTQHAVLKVIVTRGVGGRGYAYDKNLQASRVVILSAPPLFVGRHFTHGVQLQLSKIKHSQQSLLAGIKHLNRLENVLARSEITDSAMADGLMLDERGYVVEATSNNIFVRFGEILATPDLSNCGVAGVCRDKVIEIAPVFNLKIIEKNITLEELLHADEVMISNSIYGPRQVTTLEKKTWPVQSLAKKMRAYLGFSDDA